MANKYFYQLQYTYEVNSVSTYGQFLIGAAGAVTSGSVKGMGLTSVVKEATAGQYTLTFDDSFPANMMFVADVFFTTATGVAKVDILADPANFQTDLTTNKTIVIQLRDYAGAAVNAASGSQCRFVKVDRNSSVGTTY